MSEPSQTKHANGLVIELLMVTALVAAGIALRFATLSWPNLSPVAGLAMLGGLILGRNWLAVAVPLLTMALSDLWIGSYETPVMIAVYACLAWPAMLSRFARRKLRQPIVWSNAVRGASLGALGGIASATVFFVVTNWAHWRFAELAPETLTETYLAALPFLRFTLVGDLLFGTLGGCVCGIWLARTAGVASTLSPSTAQQN